jgi:hypothetical protein
MHMVLLVLTNHGSAAAAMAVAAGALSAAAAAGSKSSVHETSFLCSKLYPNFSTFSLPPLMQTSMMAAFFSVLPKEVTKSQCGKGEGITAMTR